MPSLSATSDDRSRRNLLKIAAAMGGSAPLGLSAAQAAPTTAQPGPGTDEPMAGVAGIGKGLIGYMLAHEQFLIPELVNIGSRAAQGGFHLLATSDHFQPWQANEAHAGEAWVTMGALSAHVR